MTPRLEAAIAELLHALAAEPAVSGSAAEGPERLLSIPEVADRLGIVRASVYRIVSTGQLKTIKLGRRRVCAESDLRAFIEAQR
jgi:excisionase family DNA binding protein